MTNEETARGRFEGQVIARLDSIDRQQKEQWGKMTELRKDVGDIKLQLAKGQGILLAGKSMMVMVGTLAGAFGSLVTAWLRKP